jgi:ABC-2 type transport system ATP-binding protein
MIELQNVSKRYGDLEALRGVSFLVEPGECVALLGPNGAGKTTAIEIMLGLRHATSGRVSVGGTLACTPQTTGFPDTLTVRELVAFAAAHYSSALRVDDVLEAFDLGDQVRVRAGSLSGGQQRRVALALAFVANSDIVLLDEPSTGLDVESRRRLWEQLRRGMRERTTLFTTHYLEEAEALATRIIVIDRGLIRFDGTCDDFRAQFGSRRVAYTLSGARTIETVPDSDAYVRELVGRGVPFRDLTVTQTSFEEIFLELTGAAS